ncbi:hypothetical protein DF3PB_80017 [uncultured Defluviicoccus sp.]|uniref:Uncharacterized protein n=1 Tax=metagenome TaxID=256318 RepID=A0A380TLN2_9ZZZZ|nr:hypothetical protein DF3PB_80017 [uncultured Defluviicoccus sp.]
MAAPATVGAEPEARSHATGKPGRQGRNGSDAQARRPAIAIVTLFATGVCRKRGSPKR